eukprot:547337-Pleurochrysis_carterae.AAC.1
MRVLSALPALVVISAPALVRLGWVGVGGDEDRVHAAASTRHHRVRVRVGAGATPLLGLLVSNSDAAMELCMDVYRSRPKVRTAPQKG